MTLKLMYITNNTDVAQIAENAGVDRIFVDMEYIGKAKRQHGMDTVQSHHTIKDVENISKSLKKAQLVVRVNPIHKATDDYCSSREEIDSVIEAGADLIMLPYFQTAEEVSEFIDYVGGRAITFPLLESAKAVQPEELDKILDLQGLDQIHIGINDLSLDLNKKFMFELLADGTVEELCSKIKEKGIPYGFGGIASLGKGILPSEYIIREHYRLGSQCAILSRSFCNTEKITDQEKLAEIFNIGIKEIRTLEGECSKYEKDSLYFSHNHEDLIRRVQDYVKTRSQ